ncbi:SLC13 family permease [Bacillus marasmi]|uniref:SLC13 family permease n=1 Tax=Bacillus marasmi TaxID=1926279 RepID=UPI0011C9D044|nr:SLC13 family permease [Bacillus marasmi]
MKEIVITQTKNRFNVNFNFLKKDMVFTISLLLAISTSFVNTPKLEYINLEVMVSLFNLMIVIKALEELKVLDKFAIDILNKSSHSRTVSAVLIFLSFVSSMFVTNDVALLTFVPLTLIISKKTSLNMMETVILQTIAANIGSSLTPMGNPQNLFIYSYFELKAMPFFSAILLIAVVGIGMLLFSLKRLPKTELDVDLSAIIIDNRNQALIWGILLIVIIASIFGVINHLFAFFVTLFIITWLNRSLLYRLFSYRLLLS